MLRIAFLLSVLCVTSVLAAPPNHPPIGPASIVLNEADPGLGDVVTFTVSAPKSHYDKLIQVLCYQEDPELGTILVSGMANAWNEPFHLGGGSSLWLNRGGPANCRADLFYWSYQGQQVFHLLASTTFSAAGQ